MTIVEQAFNLWCNEVVTALGQGWSVTPNHSQLSAVFSSPSRQVQMTPGAGMATIRWQPVGGGAVVTIEGSASPQEMAASILGN